MKNKIDQKISKMKDKKEFDKAIELCQKELQSNPSDISMHINLGDIYLDWHLDIYQAQQYLDEAITEYQRALELSLDSAEIHFKIGKALYFKGELNKAISHFELALSKKENYSECYYMLGLCYTRKDRFVDAIEYAHKAIKCNSFKSARANFLIYNILLSRSVTSFWDMLLAHKELIIAIFKLPFDKEAQKTAKRKLAYVKFLPIIFQGFCHLKSKEHYKAIDLYTEALEEVPGFVPLYSFLGDVYRELGRFDEAIAEYRMAIWYEPLNLVAYKALCQTYEDQGDYDAAIDIYQKLIDLNPNNPVYYSNMANILYLKGDNEQAVNFYQSAITLNPNRQWTSVIAQTLGFVLQETGKDFNAAISAYQSAYILTPKDIDIYISLGSAFYDKGDFSNALNVYRMALEVDPHNAKIHCNLGYLLWGAEKMDEAIKEYNLAIKYDPNYDIAHNNLGVIYLDDLGQIKEAVENFENAVNINPNYALAYYNLGRAMAIKNDNIEAARCFQSALDLNKLTNEMDEADIVEKLNELFD